MRLPSFRFRVVPRLRCHVALTLSALVFVGLFSGCGRPESPKATQASGEGEPVGSNQLTPAEKSAGWQLLFDGKSLAGWRASEAPPTFSVKDGCLVILGPRAHLFYEGAVGGHNFKNFELQLDAKTFPKVNSGVYFHTEYQEKGWPLKGYEIQVNNSHKDPKRTAGVYGIKDNFDAVAQDEVWFTLRIKVEGKRIQTWVNDRQISDYTEEANPVRPPNFAGRLISSGTIAIQGHDPESQIHYRNIKIRLLP